MTSLATSKSTLPLIDTYLLSTTYLHGNHGIYYDIILSASVAIRNFSRHCEKCRWVSVWHQNIGIAIVAESKHPLLQVECVWLLAPLAARDCCLLPGLRIVNSLQKFPIKILGISPSQIFGAHQSYHVTYTAPGTPTGYKWLKYEHRNHCQACRVNKHLHYGYRSIETRSNNQ